MMRKLFRQATALIVSLAIASAPFSGSSAVAADAASFERVLDQIDSSIDETRFNAAALAEEVCTAPTSEIVQQIDKRLATQIYDGVMRGVSGTLSTGAGNSWDQALVLESILRTCGVETRFAFTTLPPKEAARLIAASAPSIRSAIVTETADLSGAVEGMRAAGMLSEDLDRFVQFMQNPAPDVPANEQVLAVAEELEQVLGDRMPTGVELDAIFLEEASRYAWVQTRAPNSDKWEDHHIAFDPSTAVTLQRFSASLPPSAYHKVEVGLKIEVSDENDVRDVSVLDGTTITPGKDGAGSALLTILPDTASKDGFGDLTKAESFLVRLESEDIQQIAFEWDGSVLDPIFTDGAGEASAGIADAFSGLSSTIGGAPIGEPADAEQVTAVVIEVALQGPFQATPVLVERRIWEATDHRTSAPVGVWTINADGAAASEGELMSVLIAQLRVVMEKKLPRPNNSLARAMLSRLMDLAAQSVAEDGSIIWRGAPMTTINGFQVQDDEARLASFDIVESGLRAMQVSTTGFRAAPNIALRAGVAETWLEAGFGTDAPPSVTLKSSASAWATLSEADQFRVVSSQAELSSLGLQGQALANAAADMDRTSLLAVAGGRDVSWWRIDPATGAATGVDDRGRGGAFVTLLLLVDFSLLPYFIVTGMQDCGQNEGCMMSVLIWGLLAFGLSFGLGTSIGIALEGTTIWGAGIVEGIGAFFVFLNFLGLSLTGWNPLPDIEIPNIDTP